MQSEALEIIARAMAMTCNDSEIGWEHYTLDAEEVVTALEARGYVIVPSEPIEKLYVIWNGLDVDAHPAVDDLYEIIHDIRKVTHAGKPGIHAARGV